MMIMMVISLQHKHKCYLADPMLGVAFKKTTRSPSKLGGSGGKMTPNTWRIIPVMKWLGTRIDKSFMPFGSGTAPA